MTGHCTTVAHGIEVNVKLFSTQYDGALHNKLDRGSSRKDRVIQPLIDGALHNRRTPCSFMFKRCSAPYRRGIAQLSQVLAETWLWVVQPHIDGALHNAAETEEEKEFFVVQPHIDEALHN